MLIDSFGQFQSLFSFCNDLHAVSEVLLVEHFLQLLIVLGDVATLNEVGLQVSFVGRNLSFKSWLWGRGHFVRNSAVLHNVVVGPVPARLWHQVHLSVLVVVNVSACERNEHWVRLQRRPMPHTARLLKASNSLWRIFGVRRRVGYEFG